MIWSCRESDRSTSGATGHPDAARRVLVVAGLSLATVLSGCGGQSGVAITAALTYAGEGQTSDALAAQASDGAGTDVSTGHGAGQVVVTYAEWDAASRRVEVSGYVPGVIEDDGTCTLTLTREDVVVSGSGPALSDATTTSCGTVRVTLPAAGGDWEGLLGYRSPSSHSSSEAFQMSAR